MRRPGDDGGLHAGRAEGQRARQQRRRHQHRRQRLLRRHLEGLGRAQHDRQRQQQLAAAARLPGAPARAPAPPRPAAPCRPPAMRARCCRSTTCPATSTSASAGRNCSRPTRPRSQALPVRSYICQPTATISIWLAVVPARRANQKRMKSRCGRRTAGITGAAAPAAPGQVCCSGRAADRGEHRAAARRGRRLCRPALSQPARTSMRRGCA